MKSKSFLLFFLGMSLLALQALEAPQVQVRVEGDWRIVESNGLPDHATGRFPNAGNPHTIEPQKHVFRMRVRPLASAEPVPTRGSFFGVAVNGVPFEAGTAEFWEGQREWNYEAKGGAINLGLDQEDAHVQPGGMYHYHALPKSLVDSLSKKAPQALVLVGWAADGYPIYAGDAVAKLRSSYQLKKGRRPNSPRGPGGEYDGTFSQDYEYVAGSGDLDECHGRTAVTPEYPEGTYHYVITAEFPYFSRLWRGQPDPSFAMKGGRPPMNGPGGRPKGGRPKGGPGRPPGRFGGPGFGPRP